MDEVLHVLPAVRGWKVHAESSGRAISIHEGREQAIRHARHLGCAPPGRRVIVHDEQGAIVSIHERLEGVR
jgi:hypothetical protein